MVVLVTVHVYPQILNECDTDIPLSQQKKK
jgi:hypothetical protein